MKKLLTIPLIVLLFFSGITVNLAFHYCGGNLAEKRISLTSKTGSCGMEGESHQGQAGMKSLCCEDRVTSYTLINNFYLPATFVNDDGVDLELPVLENFSVTFTDLAYLFQKIESLKSPPGPFSPQFVDLESICILRI